MPVLLSPRVANTDADVPEVPGVRPVIQLQVGKVGELGGGPKQKAHIIVEVAELETTWYILIFQTCLSHRARGKRPPPGPGCSGGRPSGGPAKTAGSCH